MPPLTDAGEWDTKSNLGMLSRICATATQTLINSYNYNEIARMISVTESDTSEDSEESSQDESSDSEDDRPRLEPKGDDPLSPIIISALDSLESTSREGGNEFTISPSDSVAGLFVKDSRLG